MAAGPFIVFVITVAEPDFSGSFIISDGYFLPSTARTIRAEPETSRILAKDAYACLGALTPRGGSGPHQRGPNRVAFDRLESPGTPDHYLSAPMSPARIPCYRRFICRLAAADARLEGELAG